eukprot:TRINITY_DN15456_c0_g1_i1.p1 TRINITY_DN15456_c0_g1~~TRINITY_DN15456_c0_g1_i1.p1  ORF type:complete len:103 (+),score=8.14 TRINITY_DN15456_c0_g1_i1:189-497(+)
MQSHTSSAATRLDQLMNATEHERGAKDGCFMCTAICLHVHSDTMHCLAASAHMCAVNGMSVLNCICHDVPDTHWQDTLNHTAGISALQHCFCWWVQADTGIT